MKKNLIFSIVAIVLALAVIAVGVLLIIKNTGDCVITIDNVKTLAGDTVEIPIKINNNFGIWGGQIIIDYDSDKFNFVSATNGEVFNECEYNDTGSSVALLVTQTALKNSKEDGVIVTIKLGVKESVEKGKTDITFNTETNFGDSEGNLVEPILENGSVTIK